MTLVSVFIESLLFSASMIKIQVPRMDFAMPELDKAPDADALHA
jgi:hypothetical protein